jgi:hypothetical protein
MLFEIMAEQRFTFKNQIHPVSKHRAMNAYMGVEVKFHIGTLLRTALLRRKELLITIGRTDDQNSEKGCAGNRTPVLQLAKHVFICCCI